MKSRITALLVMTASLAAWAVTVAAATGVYKGETRGSAGMICHYDVNGTDRTVDIPNYAMCPQTREFSVPAPNGSTDIAVPQAVSNAGNMKAE